MERSETRPIGDQKFALRSGGGSGAPGWCEGGLRKWAPKSKSQFCLCLP